MKRNMVPYSCKKFEGSLSILSKSIQSTLNTCLSVLRWWGMSSKPCNKLHQICTKEIFVEWTIKLDIREWLIHKSRQMIGTWFLIPARELKDPSNDLARFRKAFQALGTHASPSLCDEVMSSKNCTNFHCPDVRIHRMCTKDRIGTCGRIEACISIHFNQHWVGHPKELGHELVCSWVRCEWGSTKQTCQIREIDVRSSEQTWNPVEKGEKHGIRRLERQGEMRRQSYECISCLHILSDRQPPSSFLADLLLLQRTHFATLLLHPVNEIFATFGASPSPTPPPGYECDTHFHPFFTLWSKWAHLGLPATIHSHGSEFLLAWNAREGISHTSKKKKKRIWKVLTSL